MKSATLLAILIGGCNMTLPASGYLSDSSRTHGEMAAALEDQRDAVAQVPNGQAVETVTIDTGVIEPTAALVRVNTEDSDPTDDLTNITTTPFENGALMFLWPNVNTDDVVLKHEANSNDGYLSLGADITLKTVSAVALLRCRKVTPPYFWEIVFQFPGESVDPRDEWRTRYGVADNTLHLVIYKADDTFTVPAGVKKIEVLAIGGGGGGGGGADAANRGGDGAYGGDTTVEKFSTKPPRWIVTATGGYPGYGGSITAGGEGGPPDGERGTIYYHGKGGQSAYSEIEGDAVGYGGVGGNGTGGGGGGGGGAAGRRMLKIHAVEPGDEIDVTIGAGGTGGIAGGTASAGKAGGDGAVLIRW